MMNRFGSSLVNGLVRPIHGSENIRGGANNYGYSQRSKSVGGRPDPDKKRIRQIEDRAQ